MKRSEVLELFSEIGKQKNLDSFVVLGSLVVYGMPDEFIPTDMTTSNEVDAYPEKHPQAAHDLAKEWGEASGLLQERGYYFDPISPRTATLPEGWESRLVCVTTPSGVTIKFGEMNDVAVAKYTRGEQKDRDWIRSGLEASIISLATVEYRLRETDFLDQGEHDRVKKYIEEDRIWLAGRRDSKCKP